MHKQPKRKERPGIDEYGRTPLHNALVPLCEAVDLALIQRLLGEGADPSAADDSGFTPLHFAAQESLGEATRLLLAAGANPNARDAYGNPPLFRAVMTGRSIEVVTHLLAAGADPYIENDSGVSVAEIVSDLTADNPEVAAFIEEAAKAIGNYNRKQ
jgi:uncharacterized protein